MEGELRRDVGLGGAVLLGLGSIVGTGVFVSIGIAAGITGPSVVLAVLLASVVATCNALSSAQLAAQYPVSGGTYEYGYRLLSPSLGFLAGWMFLCAKSASAAAAALGTAGYFLAATSFDSSTLIVPLATFVLVAITLLVAGGIRRSNRLNAVIVLVALGGLVLFIAAGTWNIFQHGAVAWTPFFQPEPASAAPFALMHATALMFVAFTGYGRIATLGEEIYAPHRTIPVAIIITLLVSSLLYVAVAAVAVGGIGADALARATSSRAAPLAVAAAAIAPWLVLPLSLAAVAALLGVLLNLLLGLSRVVLAMARRGDLPQRLSVVNAGNASPVAAVIFCGGIIAALALTGSVKLTWSFSALTVLIYYALTNVAALRLSRSQRRYPPIIAVTGLIGCLGLAAFIEPIVWFWGMLLAATGLAWHIIARRRRPDARD